MEESADVGQQRRTFLLELIRSVPLGLIETAGSTFAMYVAIRVYDAPMWMRIGIAAAASVGLLLSLFTVQMVRRTGWTVNNTLTVIWSLSALGFGIAAWGASSLVYFIGIGLAAMMMTLGAPLVAQIYRKHYSNKLRGRLFSIAGVVRASTGAIAGVLLGSWLADNQANFHGLFWVYSICALLLAACVQGMAKVRLRKANILYLFDAFSHVKNDRAFCKLLFCWMMLGMGNLLCFALFVEFITQPQYGYAFNAKQVGFITSTIPMVVYIIFVVPWGVIFDKLPFYRVRVLTNVFFLAGILCYYLGGSYLMLCIGIALHGVGRAGGNVLWSLWVTKFAPEEHVGEYMSVHTCFTGIRGVLAPIFAFTIAGALGPQTVAISSGVLILVSSLLLIPEIRAESKS